eukprot:TRINITY_DN46512_c0_g1_i1.p1 TRINITY_DN46512_c0_g1~~TRINITY_DN46512_c0_g1_i1.p1  ORF type:complete len:106 (+),score=27.24 TRINITY_DN46512_c0_g1_i1:46-318(+)
MLRSLVGSEMCIRDRSKVVQSPVLRTFTTPYSRHGSTTFPMTPASMIIKGEGFETASMYSRVTPIQDPSNLGNSSLGGGGDEELAFEGAI